MISDIFKKLIHETPDLPINEVSIFHHTIWIDGPGVGLASTVVSKCSKLPLNAGVLHKESLKSLAKRILDEDPLENAIGIAAINAQCNQASMHKDLGNENAFEIAMREGKNKNVSVIGAFPAAFKLRDSGICKKVNIIELDNNLIDGTISYKNSSEVLNESHVVLVTATTLINKTMFDILLQCKNCLKILVGPTTPLHPLFHEIGFDYLCGAIVEDKETAKLYLSQGASFKEAKGIRFVSKHA